MDSLDSVSVYDLDFTVNFERNGGTTGICEKSKKKENALQLLTLLYTRDDYTRLLLYGKEGKDYTVENGRVVSDKGVSHSLADVLGLFRGSCRQKRRPFTTKTSDNKRRNCIVLKNVRLQSLPGFNWILKILRI